MEAKINNTPSMFSFLKLTVSGFQKRKKHNPYLLLKSSALSENHSNTLSFVHYKNNLSIADNEWWKIFKSPAIYVLFCVVQLLSSESTYTVLQKHYILGLLKSWQNDSNSTYRWLSLQGMGNVASHLQTVSKSYFPLLCTSHKKEHWVKER